MRGTLIEPLFEFDVGEEDHPLVPSYSVTCTCDRCPMIFEEHRVVHEDWVANKEFKRT